jgi:hypothetical protein
LLVADYGKGCSATKLRWFRQFYLSDAALVKGTIHHAMMKKWGQAGFSTATKSLDIF